MYDNDMPPSRDQVMARKAQQLRALASLGTSTMKLRQVGNHLCSLGKDYDAQSLFVMADQIDRAFESIEIPALDLKS